jgi:hypothetical protein
MGFDESAAEPPGSDFAPAPDAMTTTWLGPCPAQTRSSEPFRITGTTVNINVLGGTSPRGGVEVEVSTMLDGPPMVATSSASDGRYALSVPSSGHAFDAFFALRRGGYLPSLLVPDGPIDSDITDLYSPVTTEQALASLYVFHGIARDAHAGTLGIMVLDCDGEPVIDARVSITPAPAALVYTDDSGSPNGSLTSTRSAGIVYALNVPVGTVSVTASKTGEAFLTHQVPVLDNSHVMGTRLRPVRALK